MLEGSSDLENAETILNAIELEATIRFGSRSMSLAEVLSLGPGDIVELNRLVREEVELLAGDKIVALGMAVVSDGRYGLRVTRVVRPVERLESVRCLF